MTDQAKVRFVLDAIGRGLRGADITAALVAAGAIPDDDRKEEAAEALVRAALPVASELHDRNTMDLYDLVYVVTREGMERGEDTDDIMAFALRKHLDPEARRMVKRAVKDALAGRPPRNPIIGELARDFLREMGKSEDHYDGGRA
jgi:hypothetical protein